MQADKVGAIWFSALYNSVHCSGKGDTARTAQAPGSSSGIALWGPGLEYTGSTCTRFSFDKNQYTFAETQMLLILLQKWGKNKHANKSRQKVRASDYS